ncbi:hypothetical protein ACFVIY_25460 [Streptomyces sp. NPDC127166]
MTERVVDGGATLRGGTGRDHGAGSVNGCTGLDVCRVASGNPAVDCEA